MKSYYRTNYLDENASSNYVFPVVQLFVDNPKLPFKQKVFQITSSVLNVDYKLVVIIKWFAD